MFTHQAVVFFYATTPVHVGGGTALGLIDNAIQREQHTGLPVIPGSGIKGAVRHAWKTLGGAGDDLAKLFGPEAGSNEELHSGAVGFGDALLVVFPVRSLHEGYVPVTCPLALGRAARLLAAAGMTLPGPVPVVAPGLAAGTDNVAQIAPDGKLHLEIFEYECAAQAEVTALAGFLAQHAIPGDDAHDWFNRKLQRHLVVLSDDDFVHFARTATSVEPHVRIDPQTGAASDGGLFYTETLPPESVLLAPLLTGPTRGPGFDVEQGGQVMSRLGTLLRDRQLQLGAHATTGRGLVRLQLHGGESV